MASITYLTDKEYEESDAGQVQDAAPVEDTSPSIEYLTDDEYVQRLYPLIQLQLHCLLSLKLPLLRACLRMKI